MYSARRDELPSVKARMRATAHPVRKREGRREKERIEREGRPVGSGFRQSCQSDLCNLIISYAAV
jgi:hypothetical protein